MTLGPGSRIGAYEIVEKIGAGGMGAVYKAYQTALGRYVAIKILPPQTAGDPMFAERFAAEAKATGKLRHPNIVTAFDFARDDDVAYLVSDFIDGGTLADQIGAPLPLEYAIGVLTPIASALDYAHARGVVHRDIKPQNVLMTHDGVPVLTDFGLAKIVGPGSGVTQAGTLMGTAEYIAPECASGAEVAGPAADQYALALIAYEMLVGRHPFPADNPLSALMAHVNKPVPIPSELGVTLAPGVEAALLRGLAKRPEQRFARCGDLVRALAGSMPPMSVPLASAAAFAAPSASTATPTEPAAPAILSPSALVRPPSQPPAPAPAEASEPRITLTPDPSPVAPPTAVAHAPTPAPGSAPWWRTRRILVVPGAIVLALVVLSQLGGRRGAATQTSQPPQQSAAVTQRATTVSDDHGNTAPAGTIVTLPATQTGTIDPQGDVDVFNFALRQGQEVIVELRIGSLGEGGINLISPAGDQVASESSTANGKNVSLSYRAKDSGAYHLAVHGQRGSTGNYQVVISAK